MRNGNRVRLELGLGLGSWIGLVLESGLGFYFVALLHNFSHNFRIFLHCADAEWVWH